jgi:hypothetical protein
MLAEFFRRGFARTFKYELVNEGRPGSEGVFGLLRNDLSEKPAFRAVKNLITILSDKGPNFEAGSLNYALDDHVDDIRQILFQKRNNDFYLMVWLELSSWDANVQKDLYPPAQEVLLTLFNNHNTSILPINSNQVILSVTDKISIIKLSSHTNSISRFLY